MPKTYYKIPITIFPPINRAIRTHKGFGAVWKLSLSKILLLTRGLALKDSLAKKISTFSIQHLFQRSPWAIIPKSDLLLVKKRKAELCNGDDLVGTQVPANN
jgi:hypothetical protein